MRLAKFTFFIFKEKKYARKFKVERNFSEKVVQQAFRQFLNILWDFLIQNGGQDGIFFNFVQAHRYRQEINRSNAEKKRCTYAESTRFDRVATSFLPIRFLYLCLFCKHYLEILLTNGKKLYIYTLYWQ